MNETFEAQLRQMALNLADKRAAPDATPDQILESANKFLAFLKAGVQVASGS